jgi:hypothetical protein
MANACRSRVRGVVVRLTLVHNCSTRARAAIMENRPPNNLARHSPSMHSRLSYKSSPAKRDASRILTPQHNHAVASTDAFSTGLLTPQASQNTFDSDAATSLISPPPEDSARAGINRQSVRVALLVCILPNRPIFGTSPHGPELVQNLLRTCDTLQTRAVRLSANALPFRPFLYPILVVLVSPIAWQRQVPIRHPANRRVELARDWT